MTLGYWLIVAAGLLAVVYGVVTAISVMNADAGTERMKEIAAAVQEGAGAYLNRQYRTIALAGVVILIILGFTLGRYTAIGFFIGSVLSGADPVLSSKPETSPEASDVERSSAAGG